MPAVRPQGTLLILRSMASLRVLWFIVALAALVAALVLGFGVATLYSARLLTGFSPALGLVLLQVCQVALGFAGARSSTARQFPLLIVGGLALLGGYAAVATLLPFVAGQWIFLAPLLPLVLAVASSLVALAARLRGSAAQLGRSSQDR